MGDLFTYDELAIPPYRETVFKEKTHRYCLLIPTFNEIVYFPSQIKKMRACGVFDLVDVAVCDAGSTDGCADPDMLRENGFTALLVREGKGRYSTDLRMGLGWALKMGYEGFITVDATDRDDTSSMHLFVEKLDEGYDYVQGSRYVKGGHAVRTPLVRLLAMKLICEPVMSLSARQHLTDVTNGYKAYSKRFILDKRVVFFRDEFNLHELIYYPPAAAGRNGFRIIEVPVDRIYQENSEYSTHANFNSSWQFLKGVFSTLFRKYDP